MRRCEGGKRDGECSESCRGKDWGEGGWYHFGLRGWVLLGMLEFMKGKCVWGLGGKSSS